MPISVPQPISATLIKEQLSTAHCDAIYPSLPDGDLWIFGYGSLMWRPGFAYIEAMEAEIYGFHRSLCVSSWVHRGTPEHPGLVLGLDRGGSCKGRLFRVAAANKQQVANYLFDRELPTLVYQASFIEAFTSDGNTVKALTFIVDTQHQQYTKGKDVLEMADIVSSASGLNGKSSDYLFSTLKHLRQDGIQDSHLEAIAALVKI
ncbi:MAG: gamma-glutamylcyclotransferase [Oceanospirillaceae bacterium]|nr:gamma-glutamylcyclotransferase [Oceanospirillaceae bacterium]